MAMPWQLQRGLLERRYSRRTERKPLVENLPAINVNDLKIPRDYKTYTTPNISLRYPHISSARLSFHVVEFAHSGRIQSFRIKRIKTGFGFPRPAFICQCGRAVINLYFRNQNLACRRCCNATYASRTLDKHTRPILKAHRLETFLELKTNIRKHTRHRLLKRLGEKALMPQSNYNTQGSRHWK
jgi:hypothetical protein